MNIKKTLIIDKIKGFSIVELVVIISVIGILAGITFVTYPGAVEKTKRNALITDMSNCQNALESYRNFHNKYPDSVNELGSACGNNSEQTLTYRLINDNSYDLIGSVPNLEQPYRASNSSPPEPYSGWYAFSANSNRACGIYNFKIYCWKGSEEPQPIDLVKNAILNNKAIVDISVSGEAVCALTREGEAICWNFTASSQTLDNLHSVNLSTKIDKIVAMGLKACALSDDNIYCWFVQEDRYYTEKDNLGGLGYNYATIKEKMTAENGGIEPSTKDVEDELYNHNRPKLIYTGNTSYKWLSMDGDGSYTCGINNENNVWCWGNILFEDPMLPKQVSTIKAKKISISGSGKCIIALVGDKVHCWGLDFHGIYGENQNSNNGHVRTGPLLSNFVNDGTVVFSSNVIKDINTYSGSTCIITNENIVYCWGLGAYGQLGDGTAVPGLFTATPTPVMDKDTGNPKVFNDFIFFTGGNKTICVFSASEGLSCWGIYRYKITGGDPYQFPDGTKAYYKYPTLFKNPNKWGK